MRSREQGFTITELLIAVAVSAIASLLIVSAFIFIYGSIIREQTRTAMIQQSQLFLRRMVEDIRVASEIRTTNTISDTYQPSGWTTSDPANILITTQPATDSDNNLIYDPVTGYPYYHEIVYFGLNGSMYRRTLRNSNALASVQQTTCPSGTSGCLSDIDLVGNLENMLFEFYDTNNAVTAVPEEARSVRITINLKKSIYGQDIRTTNTTRVTLRNEN